MNKLIISTAISLVILCCFSCKKDTDNPQTENKWVKLTVPEAQTIHSMTGNIDTELIIASSDGIRKTRNMGNSWSNVKENISVRKFRKKADTLFAVLTSTFDAYFSLDNGDNWTIYDDEIMADFLLKPVTLSDGTIYKIEPDLTYPKRPDQVLKSTDNGNTWVDVFPFQHYVYSIYADEDDRLYLGIIGWEWDEINQNFDSSNKNAIIYYLDN